MKRESRERSHITSLRNGRATAAFSLEERAALLSNSQPHLFPARRLLLLTSRCWPSVLIVVLMADIPVPLPEPPRVVYTRSLVPDVSITSEASPVLRHEFGHRTHVPFHALSALSRYNMPHAALLEQRSSRNTPVRQPLKPIQRTMTPVSPLSPSRVNQLPVVPHLSHSQSTAGMEHMCKLIEKHDEQLELISRQIESLLQLQKEQKDRPATCNAETMTSRIWPDDNCTPLGQRIERRTGSSGKSDARSSGKGILRKTVTHETTLMQQSYECGRNADDENDDRFFHTMLSDISDILSRSSETDDSIHVRRSPVKKRCTDRNNVTHGPETAAGSETIYIKHLAAKYLTTSSHQNKEPAAVSRHQHPAAHSYKHTRHRKVCQPEIRTDFTSIATNNYLQRYGLPLGNGEPASRTKPKNKLLDLRRLEQLPKFV